MPTEDSETPRIARACVNCNKKKIRCRFEHNQRTCDSCASLSIDCIARTRKKRKVALRQGSPAPAASYSLSEFGPTLPHQYWGSGSSPWPGGSERSTLRQSPLSHLEDRKNWSSPRGSISQVKQPGENALATRHTAPILGQEQTQTTSNAYPFAMRDISNSAYLRRDSPQGSLRPSTQIGAENEEYAGKSLHISHEDCNDEFGGVHYKKSRGSDLLDTNLKTLQLYSSLELPFRAARQSLIDTYMQKCYPWTPILGPEELDNSKERPPSMLLSQSIFLAASRVSSAPGVTAYASSEQFYQRAKALFWTSHEYDPFTVIKSAINLYWYSPDEPERFSYDNSTFWLQTAVGLAHQVGLHMESAQGINGRNRRKLWWSLVTRDCLVAAGQGRPRSINFKDYDIAPPCLEDFPGETAQGELFMSYVEIVVLLADLTECLSRKHVSQNKQLHMERALFRWSRTLAPHLQLCYKDEVSGRYVLATYDIKARQLHVPYFITMVILGRSNILSKAVSSVSILAASFVAGIFEDFLARDGLLSLGPIFTFYLLAAGVTLASLRRYQNLWPLAEQDLQIIQNSLIELSKRWPSTTSALKALRNAIRTSQPIHHNTTAVPPPLTRLNTGQSLLFDGFSPDLCRLWAPYQKETTPIHVQRHGTSGENPEIITAEILGSLRYPGAVRPSQATTPMMEDNDPNHEPSPSLAHESVGDGVGEWLIKYWDTGLSI